MSNDTEPLSGASFPPLAGTPFSERKNFLSTCTFLKIRKASTENPNYTNPDGTSLLTYSETLSMDREEARKKVIEHELAKGWLADDRASNPQAAQGIQPVVPTNGAPMTVGFSPPPVQQIVQPQQIATPAQAVAVAQQIPSAPPQMVAQPTEMPITKARRAAPKYGAAVAPPPPAPTNGAPVQFQTPAPPPGASVVVAAPFGLQQVPQAAPAAPVMAAPAPAPVQAQAAQVGAVLDLGPVVARVDEIGRGMSIISKELDTQKSDIRTMVSNLSAQINETNKALATLQRTAEYLMVAAHHMYLTNPATMKATDGKAPDIDKFKGFLTTYLSQNPQ